MVQRPLVGAADIHARAPPDRLQPPQHLDRGGVIIVAGGGGGREQIGHVTAIRRRASPCQARHRTRARCAKRTKFWHSSSEEPRVGKEWDSTYRIRGSPYNKQKKKH